MAREMVLFLTAAVLVVLTACGSGGAADIAEEPGGEIRLPAGDGMGDREAGGDQPPVVNLVECHVNDDCPGDNRICDCMGKCTDAGSKACEEDKNCGGKGFCDPCTKMCYDKLKLCQACTSEHLCNPLTGECRPVGNQCEVDGSHCLDFVTGGSYCGRACLSNAGCPPGFTCEDLTGFGLEYMQCIPKSWQCASLGDCEQDLDCEFGYVCNPEHFCVKGCESDAECPQGLVCSGFRCKQACDPVNNPCPEGQECKDGRCMIPGGCIDAYDCPAPETFCNPGTNLCSPGCLNDIDCKSGSKECVSGKCELKACTANYWCSFGLVCDLEAGDCVEPPEPFCEPGCEKDEECGPAGSKCLQLQDEEGNDKGKFCFPACYADPDNLCPQGYQCTELVDQDGASQGKVCARTCYEAPVGFY